MLPLFSTLPADPSPPRRRATDAGSADRKALNKAGSEFIVHFNRLIRGSRMYNSDHDIVRKMAEDCLATIEAIFTVEGSLQLRINKGLLYANGQVIASQPEYFRLFKGLANDLWGRAIGTITFHPGVKAPDLQALAAILNSLEEVAQTPGSDIEDAGPSNAEQANTQLAEHDVTGIEVGPPREITAHLGDRETQAVVKSLDPKELYVKAIDVVKEVMQGITNRQQFTLATAKHVMQQAVNTIMEDESSMIALTTIKNYDEYTYSHSVNVSLVSIALGHRAGLYRSHLSRLGLAALFHDLGKTKIPLDLLNKPGRLEDDEWKELQNHSVMGAVDAMLTRPWGDMTARLVSAALQHHMRFDHQGYPKFDRDMPVSLAARIISVADVYDALGRPRVYRGTPFPPEKVLAQLIDRSGRDFDPAIVKLLVNMVGVYPLGTIVRLDSGEMAVVVRLPEGREQVDRPVVCIIEWVGDGYRKGELVDLIDMDAVTGRYQRTVAGTLDPGEHRLNILDFLL